MYLRTRLQLAGTGHSFMSLMTAANVAAHFNLTLATPFPRYSQHNFLTSLIEGAFGYKYNLSACAQAGNSTWRLSPNRVFELICSQRFKAGGAPASNSLQPPHALARRSVLCAVECGDSTGNIAHDTHGHRMATTAEIKGGGRVM